MSSGLGSLEVGDGLARSDGNGGRQVLDTEDLSHLGHHVGVEATDAVRQVSPRTSLVIKADIREGVTGQLTQKVEDQDA